jgi:BON domain
MPTEQVEQQITHHLVSEPALANTNIDAKVDDNSVVLTGTGDADRQYDLAVQIPPTYAGARQSWTRSNFVNRHEIHTGDLYEDRGSDGQQTQPAAYPMTARNWWV